jgi:hypothetical protein
MNSMPTQNRNAILAGEILPPQAFDYSVLPTKIANQALAAAERIRNRAQQQIMAIMDTGRDLLTVKEQLKHGQFSTWLKAEFNMTDRTAQNYMQAATEFGTKTEIISDLPLTALYRLAAPSTPASVKEAVIDRLKAGERVGTQEVQEFIREAKDADKKALEDAKRAQKKPPSRAQRQAEQEQRQRAEERLQRIIAERNARTNALVALLAEKLGPDLPAALALWNDDNALELRYLLQKVAKSG